jgi:putative membrane protein
MRFAIGICMAAFAMTTMAAPARGKDLTSTSTRHMTDKAFVMEAASGDMAEVELGKIAEARASSDQVKNLAKQMVDDHAKALDDLKMVASKDNITVPSTLDPRDQALKNRLSKLSGATFDREYLNSVIKNHRQDVADFRTESRHAHNAQLKEYATKMLPMLEEHLKVAVSADHAIKQVG